MAVEKKSTNLLIPRANKSLIPIANKSLIPLGSNSIFSPTTEGGFVQQRSTLVLPQSINIAITINEMFRPYREAVENLQKASAFMRKALRLDASPDVNIAIKQDVQLVDIGESWATINVEVDELWRVVPYQLRSPIQQLSLILDAAKYGKIDEEEFEEELNIALYRVTRKLPEDIVWQFISRQMQDNEVAQSARTDPQPPQPNTKRVLRPRGPNEDDQIRTTLMTWAVKSGKYPSYAKAGDQLGTIHPDTRRNHENNGWLLSDEEIQKRGGYDYLWNVYTNKLRKT